MTELKTQKNNADPIDFINSVEDETKRKDSLTLLKIFEEITGKLAVMWGTSIIGFDMYHYKSERSSQEGDWPMTAFSPRKQNLTLYITPGFDDFQDELAKLGKHKTSVGCLYIKKLADVDLDVLKKIITDGYAATKKKYNS